MLLSKLKRIIPALEFGDAIAHVVKVAYQMKKATRPSTGFSVTLNHCHTIN